jgi:hypothetical protein
MSDQPTGNNGNQLIFASAVQTHRNTMAQFMAAEREHTAQLYGASVSRTIGSAHLIFGRQAPNTALPDATLLLQTVIERGEKTSESELIIAVTIPWSEIVAVPLSSNGSLQ